MMAKNTNKKDAKTAAKKSKMAKPSIDKTSLSQPVDKKLWPFYILKVLKRHAPEGAGYDDAGNRYLTRHQIVDFLADDYGIHTQIKAVGDNLTRLYNASLEDPSLGFQLDYLEGERNIVGASSDTGEKQLLRRGWRYIDTENRDSDFQPSEVRMLVDTVIASSVIPSHQVEDLIKNLCKLTSEKIVVPNIRREGLLPAENPDFFLNIEIINEAIQRKKCVVFYLGSFRKDGKLHKASTGRRTKPHRVVPLQLLISKGHYYLLAHYINSEEIYKFRIDLIKEIEIDEDSSVDTSEPNVNVVTFRERHSYMMSGKEVQVELRINKESLHTLYDQFGPNVHFKNEQDNTIDVVFRSALYSVLFWSLQYYRSVEVLSPPELREVLADAGRTIADMYSGKPGSIDIADRQSKDELINDK